MTIAMPDFIVVDDNKVDCFIAEKIIRTFPGTEQCLIFPQALQALEHIRTSGPKEKPTVVLVDIRMPVMNGFEFVEAFEHFPAYIRRAFVIYILSSSMNEHDIARGKGFPSVRGFLTKPLTHTMIKDVVDQLTDRYV